MNVEELVDIKDIKIDQNDSREKKINDYLTQIKNPYKYKDGKYTITVEYNECGGTFLSHFERLIKTMKQTTE